MSMSKKWEFPLWGNLELFIWFMENTLMVSAHVFFGKEKLVLVQEGCQDGSIKNGFKSM